MRPSTFPSLGLWAALVMSLHAVVSVSADAAPAQIPALSWGERSDWINVKTGIVPAAAGDGRTDDTAAIQKAFDSVRDGSVLYFPPGIYRVSGTLQLRRPQGARWIGGLIVGSGRDTQLVWDGGAEPMLILDGVAYSRFVGLEQERSPKPSHEQ